MSAPVDAETFKAAMRRFASGVTVVTTVRDGSPIGFTATAFTSVSAEPPMVLICVNRSSRSHPLIARAGFFCVNLLAFEQLPLGAHFSSHAAKSFEGVPYHAARSGAPVLDGALAFFDCELSEEHTAGTHTIFLGTVIACGQREGRPLGYLNGGYRDFG